MRLPRDEQAILGLAARTLTRALRIDRRRYESQLQSWDVTDWRADPFARGAYSWIPRGAEGFPQVYGEPVGDTLFFRIDGYGHYGHHHHGHRRW